MAEQLQGLRRNIGIALLVLALAQAPLYLAACLLFSIGTGAAAFCLLANGVLLGLAWQKMSRRLGSMIRDEQDAQVAAARRLETERAAHTRSTSELTQTFEKTFAAFREDMFGRLSSVKVSTDALNQTTDQLSKATLHITSETTAVAVAVEDAQRQIATVVTSGQEFLTTISAIGAHAARSTNLGVEAIDLTRATAHKIKDLACSFDKIGSMAAFISAIANQTNLLALNATIEAARAGEQGKGFAVVAGEVKSLATETTKAVALIADLVATIRGAMGRVDAAMQTTAASIEGLNQATAEIAAAVNERVDAANHMAQSVERSAFNVGFVTKAIGDIEIAIDEAAAGMSLLRDAASEITMKSAAVIDRLEDPIVHQGTLQLIQVCESRDTRVR